MGGQPKEDWYTKYANQARQQEIDKQSAINLKKTKEYEYGNLFNEATRNARLKAEQGVTAERTEGMTKASKLLTDYQAQERRRLFEAKKGAGQVGKEDYAITQDMRKEAQGLLDRGSDYWDAKRTLAGDTAYAEAEKKFVSDTGTKDAYVLGAVESEAAAKKKAEDEALYQEALAKGWGL